MVMSKIISKQFNSKEPRGRDRRASEIEYLFSVSFPLVGNPSDCSDRKKDSGHARMTDIRGTATDTTGYSLKRL